MTLSELRLLVREYVNDLDDEKYLDEEIDRALNESQKQIAVIMQEIEPSILHEMSTITTAALGSSPFVYGQVDEYLLPSNFRKMIAVLRLTEGDQAAIANPVMVEVVPFDKFWLYGDYPGSGLDEYDIAYVRDFTEGDPEGVLPSLGRLLNSDGTVFDGTAPALRQSVIGFAHNTDALNVSEKKDILYYIHYQAYPPALVVEGDTCQLPPEYHELVGVDAAANVLRHDKTALSGVAALRGLLMDTMVKTLPGRTGSNVEAR